MPLCEVAWLAGGESEHSYHLLFEHKRNDHPRTYVEESCLQPITNYLPVVLCEGRIGPHIVDDERFSPADHLPNELHIFYRKAQACHLLRRIRPPVIDNHEIPAFKSEKRGASI